MKELRRQDRAINNSEALNLLSQGEYGFLMTISEDGTPYGVPVNYCSTDQLIYIHCAVSGEKLDNLRRNNNVSFTVVGQTKVIHESFGTLYESVIVRGKAREVSGTEKQSALEEFVNKYSSSFKEQGSKYIEAMSSKTVLVVIDIISLSGKARR